MTYPADQIKQAIRHLRQTDPILRDVIERAGPFQLKLERDRFQMLVRSILAQQISTSAARAIRERLYALVAPERITPETMARLSIEELRSVGVSMQKGTYLRDLAQKVLDRQVRLKRVGRMSDEEIIEELIQVKGIGVWTAQMFLMFSVGRLDVFPHDDLGIRSALRNLYGLKELPNKAAAHKIAEPWRPYATVASWYCWRSLEFARERRNGEPI